MCHDYSAGGKTFTQCHTKSHGVAFDTQVLWLLANGREACALLCNHRSLLHVFSLVQTTIGFGNPCRIGSLAYHMRSVCVSGAQAVDNWLCRCHWSNQRSSFFQLPQFLLILKLDHKCQFKAMILGVFLKKLANNVLPQDVQTVQCKLQMEQEGRNVPGLWQTIVHWPFLCKG